MEEYSILTSTQVIFQPSFKTAFWKTVAIVMAHLWGWHHAFWNPNMNKIRPCGGHSCLHLPIQITHLVLIPSPQAPPSHSSGQLIKKNVFRGAYSTGNKTANEKIPGPSVSQLQFLNGQYWHKYSLSSCCDSQRGSQIFLKSFWLV